MPTLKIPPAKQIARRSKRLTLSFPLTWRGIDAAYDRLERVKAQLPQAIVRAELKTIMRSIQERSSTVPRKQLQRDLDDTIQEVRAERARSRQAGDVSSRL